LESFGPENPAVLQQDKRHRRDAIEAWGEAPGICGKMKKGCRPAPLSGFEEAPK